MIQELETQFQEISIRTLLSQMDEIFHLLRDSEGNPYFDSPDFSRKEIIAEKRKEFAYLADRVYTLSIAYMELKGLAKYIEKFDVKILPFYKDRMKLSDISDSNIYDEEESLVTKTYRQFLYSFRGLGGGEEKHLTGLDYLENILKATNRILDNKSVKPSKEVEVYSETKIVFEATFPSAQYLGGQQPFYQLAKYYKPDILIPFLNCAIEYKFATSETDLTARIDEILIDVKGYSNHPIYKFFYAVFYVKTGVTTEKRFDQIWQRKNFPENWRKVFIEGPVLMKKKVAKKK